MKTCITRHGIISLLLLTAGCSVGPDYKRPDLTLPDHFSNAAQQAEEAAVSPSVQWWNVFEDPLLSKLIDDALRSNLDLQLAQARVREARALVAVSRVGFIPDIRTGASYTRSKESENTRTSSQSFDQSDDEGITNSPAFGRERDLYDAGFDASWEIDIFGGVRRDVEAAHYRYQARLDSMRDVLVTLLSEVAQSYLALRGAQARYDIALRNIESEKETLDIQRTKLRVGLANDLTVAQAEALLQSTTAQLPALEIAIRQAIHRLGILLGREPQALQETLQATAPILKGPPVVPPGLPSELLRRRPDIRQAEHVLAAATADIGVAVSEFFPKLELLGGAGVRSEDSGDLFSSSSFYWSAGPSVRWNILNWYAVLAAVDLQTHRQEQALILYRQSVLRSLEEVENALVAYSREQTRTAVLETGVEASQRALKHAKELYDAGLADFLDVLTAQQTLYRSEDELEQSRQATAGNLIALYKALGGGWEDLLPAS